MIFISIANEDDLSEAVMTRMLSHFDNKYEIINRYSRNGFGYLKKNIKGFNQASIFNPFFMLTDLDTYDCPLGLMNNWIKFKINKNFIFRIAVREVESWVMADREGLSEYFNVSVVNFPRKPDEVDDPKKKIIQLASRSRKRTIKEDIVPINCNASIGPNYNACLSYFVYKKWDIERAITNSESLKRAYNKLRDFKQR